MAEKEKRVTVLLKEAEFTRFEAYCEEKGHHKSTLIARLIRDHLDSEQFQMQRTLAFGRREAE